MASFNANRLYGVEIEFLERSRYGDSIYDHHIVDALLDHGLDIEYDPDRPYGHDEHQRDRTGLTRRRLWKLVTDGSCGWELVSPPMSGVESFEQIEKVCKALQSIGAKVDTNCGIHVHHDARSLSATQVMNIALLYAAHQDTISMAMPDSRQSNTYAHPRSYWELKESYERAMEWARRNGMTGPESSYSQTDLASEVVRTVSETRYNTVNLASYNTHGTIEFRQHQGSLNPAKIRTWVVFTQTFMEEGLTRQYMPEPKADGYGASDWDTLKSALGLDKPSKSCEVSRAAGKAIRKRMGKRAGTRKDTMERIGVGALNLIVNASPSVSGSANNPTVHWSNSRRSLVAYGATTNTRPGATNSLRIIWTSDRSNYRTRERDVTRGLPDEARESIVRAATDAIDNYEFRSGARAAASGASDEFAERGVRA